MASIFHRHETRKNADQATRQPMTSRILLTDSRLSSEQCLSQYATLLFIRLQMKIFEKRDWHCIVFLLQSYDVCCHTALLLCQVACCRPHFHSRNFSFALRTPLGLAYPTTPTGPLTSWLMVIIIHKHLSGNVFVYRRYARVVILSICPFSLDCPQPISCFVPSSLFNTKQLWVSP